MFSKQHLETKAVQNQLSTWVNMKVDNNPSYFSNQLSPCKTLQKKTKTNRTIYKHLELLHLEQVLTMTSF